MPGETIVALVAVYVALEEIALRKFIRRTWGRKVKVGSKMRLVFVVGKSENNLEMSGIQEENNSHHDIIQANFIDTYRNLTLKSLALFRWTDRYCRNAKHILKIDSDMKIDLSKLMTVLQTTKIPDRFICGYLLVNHSVVRHLDSKWYVPFDTYPNEHFPNYCQGAAYITTHRIGRRIARVSVPPNPFPIDDAYITGILRESLGEGIERRIISFKHHYNQTETKVMKGDFMKYIMTVYVDGSGDKEIKGTASLKNN
ncbi:hypothetical protein FSP39_022574 [Pinctada imbricata]|uniref:Hexosyltransferase n=1 Tax=Pinctada imbricata TaxID=66713 RepID=A0AA88YG37_PINIB|nr:hypothetical protein FSP39_022574 [Pinctada imbricata]